MIAAALALHVFAWGRSAAAACPPIVLVEGDLPVVSPIEKELAERGVSTVSQEGCPSVDALIRRSNGRLLLEIHDRHGRVSGRSVVKPETAATVIESWARDDLSAPLLATRSMRIPVAPSSSGDSIQLYEPPSTENNERSIALSALAETSLASDGSLWLGVRAGGCVEMGPVCVGASARFAQDSRFSGSSNDLGTSRVGLDVLLAVELPLRMGDIELSPGLAFGAGWLQSTRTSGAGQKNVQVDGGGMRADAHVTVSIPLAHRFALDVCLSADLSVLAHTPAYQEEGITLAGQPWGSTRAGIGLRYGVP